MRTVLASNCPKRTLVAKRLLISWFFTAFGERRAPERSTTTRPGEESVIAR